MRPTDEPANAPEHLHWAEAPQAAFPLILCLAAGLITKHPGAGALAAGGAFTTGFAPFNALYRTPAFSMLITGTVIALSATLGNLCGLETPVLYAGIFLWAFLAALLTYLGKHPSWVGTQATIYFMVSAYFAQGAHYAVDRGLLLGAGALLQWIFYVGKRWATSGSDEPIWAKSPILRGTRAGLRLRDQLNLRSAVFEYALRVACTLLLCTAIYREFSIRNGYWIPMTALLVMKPEWKDTKKRSLARILGTFGGAIVASILVIWVKPDPAILAGMAVAFAAACYALQHWRYSVFSASLTAYIVFLLSFSGYGEHTAIDHRAFCTALGGLLGLTVDYAWMRWSPARLRPLPDAPKQL